MSDYILKVTYVALFTIISATFLSGAFIFGCAAQRCFDTHDFVGFLICAGIAVALLASYVKLVIEQCELDHE
jgi:predicted Kef-type K+ transport protein